MAVRRLGFIGLGAIGAPMAKMLVTCGFQLSVFDILAERIRPLVEAGARGASSAGEVSENAEAIIIMVMNASQVEDVLFGDDSAVQALAPGSTVILMSTIGPEKVRALAGRLAESELRVLDAPVSGGPSRAETGDLLVMVGGAQDLLDEARPVLETMGSAVVHCGESPGDGQAVKMVNQLLVGIHLAAAGEALAYADALGLDPRFVFEAVKKGAANSFMLENRADSMLSGEFASGGSKLEILIKDVDLAVEAAKEHDFHAPLGSTANEIYQQASGLGLGDEEDAGVIRIFQRHRQH
jgi:3-hydroxyisobutyrate dehydrogenase-like beta-hydroxyacid dehydrogenase